MDMRRRALARAVRRERPHEVLYADGWGEELVLKGLRRRIDDFGDGGPDGPSPAA
jgi:hypothetical protein